MSTMWTTPVDAVPSVINLPGRFQAEDYKVGGEGVGYHDTTVGNSGGAYRTDNVDIQTCTDGTSCYNINYIRSGEWLAYPVNVELGGSYTFRVRVASLSSNQTFHIERNLVNITGPITVPNTGSWQNWTTIESRPIELPSGTAELRIVADGNQFNINWVAASASPTQHQIMYEPPQHPNGTLLTNDQVVATFDAVIFDRNRIFSNVGGYESAGFDDPVMQYIIMNEAVGPSNRFASPSGQTQGCTSTERSTAVWKNNVTMETGAFCQIQDSIAGVSGRTYFDHDLDATTPGIRATENWFVHHPNGNRYVRDSGGGDAYYPNPGNQRWQEYFNARTRREILGGYNMDGSPRSTSGANGVFLDNLELNAYWFTKTENGGVLPAEYDTSAEGTYADAVYSMVQKLSATAQSHNYPLWANMVDGNNNGTEWNRYSPLLDGGFHEFFGLRWDLQGYSSATIKNQLIQAQTWLANGNTFLSVGWGHTFSNSLDRDKEARFAFATYLLIADGSKSYYYYRDPTGYETFNSFPEYGYRLGKPIETRQEAVPNLLTRRFTCGTVTVDLRAAPYTGTIAYDANCP